MDKILACGVPRSGSTLVWQILLRALPMREVIKAHPGSWKLEDGYFIVGSIRHPYDLAASRFRSRVVGDKGDGSPGTVAGTKKGLVAELRGMASNFAALRMLMDRYPEKTVVLRYEDFFNNFDVVFNMIAQKLGGFLSCRQMMQITKACSFKENFRRSYTKTRGKEDRNTRINPGHVGVGVPGHWRVFLPQWGYGVMKKWCGPLCKEWGYESQR